LRSLPAEELDASADAAFGSRRVHRHRAFDAGDRHRAVLGIFFDRSRSSRPQWHVSTARQTLFRTGPLMTAAQSLPTFAEIYDAHVDYLWRAALRMGLDEAAAEDVIQQVFMVAFRRRDDFEGRASLRTWLFGILLRHVRQHRRLLQRKSPYAFGASVDPDLLIAPGDAPDVALARTEAGRLVRRFLEQIGDEKAEVFILMEIEKKMGPEVAALLEIPLPTVYSRQRAAREQFEAFIDRIRKRNQ
jgi:RNA polymerase sigma-70 factor, ECF subfamily